MNVLLINPELSLSFWSLRKSCKLTGRKTLGPPLGLITVAALLPREWQLRLVDLNTRRLTEADWNWADIVMISAMFLQKNGLLALVREGKQKGKITVVGGPYPTSMPGEMLEAGCDFIVRGEAENTIPLLLETLNEERKGIVIENDARPDISNSPVPRFDLLRLNDYGTLSIQTSRGCPFDCEFCDVISLFGRKPRYKNPDQVILELETLYRLGVRRQVFICDDNFIGSKRHARGILHRMLPWMENHNKPFGFTIQASVDLGQDMEMIDLMTEANFGEVIVGIESPDKDVLERTRKYQNLRNPLAESLNNICKNGLSVIGSFIIGFDGEKRGAGERICSLVDETNIPIVMVNTLQAPPNTQLWHRLKKEGRLLEDRGTGEATFTMPNFVPTRPEPEIIDEYTKAWDYLYEPCRFLERTYHYYLTMRPTRLAMAMAKGEKVPPSRLKPGKRPLRCRLREIPAFVHFLLRRGICPPYMCQFWRQLIGIWRKNPSRMHKYLANCIMGEDLIDIRDEILKRAAYTQENLETETLPKEHA